MAQLNAETAAKVEKAEDGFKLLDPHIAILKLVKDVEVGEGKAGPYWKWQFKATEANEIGPNRQYRHITSLSEAAFFKLKEAFIAFGKPLTTPTEDLVGLEVRAQIVVETIKDGNYAGEMRNNIKTLLPLLDEDGKPGFVGKTGDAPKQDATSMSKAGGAPVADEELPF